MKQRFILYRRKVGGMFYIEDTETRKQESLGTKDRNEAKSLLNARNESVRQPQLNLHIAKAYLAGTDSGVSTRTYRLASGSLALYQRPLATGREGKGTGSDSPSRHH